MPPAFIILDVQNDFFDSANPNLIGFLNTVSVINHTAAFFRRHHWPVIFIQHTSAGKPEGSRQWELYEGFNRLPEDVLLTKGKQNAFEGTQLQNILKTRKASHLLFAGFLADYCVLNTYRAALELGYQAYILKNGTASLDCEVTLDGIEANIQFAAEAELDNVFSINAE